jgi:antitoxin component of MazEF toxin-antitoxin module
VPTVTIHYSNWVMLPERVLKALGLTTGDRLEVELAGSEIVLRGAGRAGEPNAELPSSIVEEHQGEDAGALPEEPALMAPRPATARARGRRRKE